jgi:DNA processing protein
MIAVVGSRKFTAYGKQVAYSLAQDLARSGVTVVSGMALGIDALAHRGALSVHGKTLAILGSGLEDRAIGPRLNFQLSREIMEHGALLSEFPVGTKITPGNFPARNRIMAGMTLGTLVIEAAENSGSLITANLACEFNREVFSIPGSIFSQASAGTNKLIQTGSKLVTGVADILAELRIEHIARPANKNATASLSDAEQKILKLLSSDPVHVDKLIKATTLKTSEISALLSMMEVKGLLKNIGSQNYIII